MKQEQVAPAGDLKPEEEASAKAVETLSVPAAHLQKPKDASRLVGPLSDPERLKKSLSSILNDTCDFELRMDVWPDIPARPSAMTNMPVSRVIKKGMKGKDKSTKGYVWMDTDPVAILTNKYVTSSCHTLDNTQYNYRTGNFNYIYTPFMGCIFAGARHPSQTRPAASPVSGHILTDWYDDFQRREYQAVANIFLMRDEEQRPFLVMTRLYDSANEYPWTQSILRYVATHASRLGLGFAVGVTWDSHDYHANENLLERFRRGYDKARRGTGRKLRNYPHSLSCETYKVMRTPFFELPFEEDGRAACLPGYGTNGPGDDNMGLMEGSGAHRGQFCWFITPRILFLPQHNVASDFDVPECPVRRGSWGVPTGVPTFVYVVDPTEAGQGKNGIHCDNCNDRVDEDDAYHNDSGDSYCVCCYNQLYTHCGKCQNEFFSEEVYDVPNGKQYCQDCAEENFVKCNDCREYVDGTTKVKVVGQRGALHPQELCNGCLSHCKMCEDCEEWYDTRRKPDFGEVVVVSPLSGVQEFVCQDCLDVRNQAVEDGVYPLKPVNYAYQEAQGQLKIAV